MGANKWAGKWPTAGSSGPHYPINTIINTLVNKANYNQEVKRLISKHRNTIFSFEREVQKFRKKQSAGKVQI